MTPHLDHAAPMELASRVGDEAINITLLMELRVTEKSKRDGRPCNHVHDINVI